MTGATAPRLQLELIAARILLPGAVGEAGYAARLDRLERRLDVGGVPSSSAGSVASAGAPAPAPARQAPVQQQPVQQAPVQQAPVPMQQQAPASGRPPIAPAVQPSTQPDLRPPQHTLPPSSPAAPQPGHDEPPPEPDHDPGEPEFLEPGAPRAPQSQPAARQQPAPQPATTSESAADSASPSAPAGPSAAPARPGGLDTAAIRRSWPDVLAKVFELRRTTWTFVSEHAQVLDYDGERLLLGISTTGLANTFRRGPHATYVQQALIDVLGIDARVEGVPADGSAPEGGVPGVATINPNRPDPAPRSASEPTRASAPPQSPVERAQANGAAAQGEQERAGEPAAYVQSSPPPTQADWGNAGNGSASPAWATPQPGAAEPEPVSPFARAKEAVAAEPDPDEPPVADDSAMSEDDEDIEGLGEVGVPVIERVLGGTVISEEQA
jgi:DNA polymerase-3 subunit gamma/tau